jgi:thiol-disulfide isomerase/thioredoxin
VTSQLLENYPMVSIAIRSFVLLVGALQHTSRADDPKESQNAQQSTTETVQESRTTLIRVLDETGQPLPQVNVHVTGIGPEGNLPRRDFPTSEQGEAEFTYPIGTRVLQIWPSKQGYVPQVVGFKESEREQDKAIPKEYVFHFQPGNRLSGLVVDRNGKPIVRAKVQVKLNGEAEVSDKSKSSVPRAGVNTWLAFGSGAAVTDAQGRWEINNAPTLTVDSDSGFQLMVTHPQFTGDRTWGETQQRQGITNQQLRDGTAKLTMERGIAISGSITGPDGEKVTKGLVIWDDRPYWATGINETQIDERGRYKTLRLAPGDYPVTVVAPGYAPDERTISVSPSLKDVDFQLKPGNPIRIKIVDQYGYAIPKAGVQIGQWRGTEAIYNHKHSNVPESGIPRGANADGVYAWDWAPADGVQYQIGAKGYDAKEVTLVAKSETHIVELVRPITILGTVVDAQSGEPIEQFRVIPVKAFRPDFYSTNFQTGSVAHGKDGNYKIQISSHGQTGNRYRVRIEAEGYRTAFGQKSLAVGDPPLEEHFELEKSPSRIGKVLSPNGEPVNEFSVVIGTPTIASRFSLERLDTSFSKAFRIQGKDQFELPATFEPSRIRVFNDSGFAELFRQPDEPIGTINLQPWASVSGHLVQGGKPISNEWINFYPLVKRGLTEARFQGSFSAKTDLEGHFNFDRLPPMSGSIRAYLGPWQDSVLTSSRSVSLDLEAGGHEEISLGGEGGTIAGRVVATGRSNDSLSKNWSLNYLVSRGQGIDYPGDVEPLSFDASGPLNAAWLRQPDFHTWLATRENHFVKLADDGRLRIHGVRPGSYDLVIQLYEQPAGCLVETIGEKVLPVTVTDDQIGAGEVKLGNIEVECRIGPRAGTDMRAFKFTDSDGRVRLINEMSDRYVLLHVWASWCQPCLASMPEVQAAVEQYADDRLTVVGLNIDEDIAAAKSLVQAGGWNWAHTYLGDDSDMMRQLAVSSVPTYYLIGPDGKLVGSANAWKQLQPLLSDSLR